MLEIAEFLSPYPTRLWQLVRQLGISHAVGIVPYDPPDDERNAPLSWEVCHGQVDRNSITPGPDGAYPWSFQSLQAMQARFAAAGLTLAVIESSPPMELVRLGLPGRDEEIEIISDFVRSLGRLGIPVWVYNFLAAASWGRTSVEMPSRGGALVTAFDVTKVPPLSLPPGVELTQEQLWDNLQYFLERVLPVAEEAGVMLALHPDDPPLPQVGGVPRIMNTIEAFDKLLDMAPSPANGLTFCQGNFTLMTDDLPGLIDHFGGQGRIAFVHFRDVRGTPENFAETFHDDGPTDMLACMRAYRDIGFEGVLRPDHVPTLVGEANAAPGYETLGRLHAVGYISGLRQAAYEQA
jgi:mannonate dehydratase